MIAATALFACRIVASSVLIPAWQQPDEPSQVAVAEVFKERLLSIEAPDPGREAEILQSMTDHDWWRHYGANPPAQLPRKFALLPGVVAGTLGVSTEAPDIPKPYYTVAASILSVLPRMPVAGDLYVMRAFSSVLAILTLWVAWVSVRQSVGDLAAAMVAALIALHPQFTVVATTASADGIVNLAGACVWWQGIQAVQRRNAMLRLAGVWVAALGAAMTDRMGIPLLVIACGISVAAALRGGISRKTVALVGAAALLLGASMWLLETVWQAFGLYALRDRVLPVPQALTAEFVVAFARVFFESWWSTLGWARYTPPSWWTLAALLFSAAALFGFVLRIMRSEDGPLRTVMGVAALVVAMHVVIVCWVYFRIASGTQGRYLFPSLVPTLLLIWLGVEAWAPIQFRRHAAIAAVTVFALLDCGVWMFIAIPAYAV